MRLTCAAVVAVLVLGTSVGVADRTSESPAHLRLGSRPRSLLGGQLAFALPADMKITEPDKPLSTGVLPASEDEVRATLEHENARFVLMAYETNASVGTKFRSGVLADLRAQGIDVTGAKIQKLALPDQLLGFEVVPKLPRTTLDASVLVYAAYIATVDGTVQLLAFYISTDALPFARAWTGLARKIATSATLGRRRLDTTAGDRRIVRTLVDRTFVITTPAGWMVASQIGTDRDPLAVHQLRQIVPLGEKASTCALRIGRAQAAEAGTISGTILNTKVMWNELSDVGGPSTHTTAQQAWRDYDLDVTCRAPDQEQLPALRTMVESLRAEVK
jgi:hypothetical protein